MAIIFIIAILLAYEIRNFINPSFLPHPHHKPYWVMKIPNFLLNCGEVVAGSVLSYCTQPTMFGFCSPKHTWLNLNEMPIHKTYTLFWRMSRIFKAIFFLLSFSNKKVSVRKLRTWWGNKGYDKWV